jgi:hypothetical protein
MRTKPNRVNFSFAVVIPLILLATLTFVLYVDPTQVDFLPPYQSLENLDRECSLSFGDDRFHGLELTFFSVNKIFCTFDFEHYPPFLDQIPGSIITEISWIVGRLNKFLEQFQ